MGIDSIGKKGPPLPSAPPGADASRATRPDLKRPFDAPTVQKTAPTDASAGPQSALERLRAGQIDVRGYVDIKVDEATSHLSSLPAEQLDQVRSALRDRLVADPTLVDLVRTATGSVPQPPPDE